MVRDTLTFDQSVQELKSGIQMLWYDPGILSKARRKQGTHLYFSYDNKVLLIISFLGFVLITWSLKCFKMPILHVFEKLTGGGEN